MCRSALEPKGAPIQNKRKAKQKQKDRQTNERGSLSVKVGKSENLTQSWIVSAAMMTAEWNKGADSLSGAHGLAGSDDDHKPAGIQTLANQGCRFRPEQTRSGGGNAWECRL